jgi:hypothetical protein
MSALIFSTTENSAVIATDTLAVSNDGSCTPSHFSAKAYMVPHLRLIIAGTGLASLIAHWAVAVSSELFVDCVEGLDTQATELLRPLNHALLHNFVEMDEDHPVASTIYHFGFSSVTNKMRCFKYHSGNGFASEELPYGTAIKPEGTYYQSPDIFQTVIMTMKSQKLYQEQVPIEKRLGIGGEILLYTLDHRGFNAASIYKFDDYQEMKDAMLIHQGMKRP